MYEYQATLARIIDGDTFELDIDLGLRVHTRASVRLHGVDTPETFGVRRDSKEWRRGQAAKTYAERRLSTHGPTLRVRTFKMDPSRFARGPRCAGGPAGRPSLDLRFKDRTEKFGRWLVEIEDPESGEKLGEDLVAADHAQRVDW